MSKLGLVVALLLLLVPAVSAGEFRVPGMRPNETYYTIFGLKKLLVGQMVSFENGATVEFQDNGDYVFTPSGGGDAKEGRYVFGKHGMVCAKLDDGRSRCDTFVRSDRYTYALTSAGVRWKVGTIAPKEG